MHEIIVTYTCNILHDHIPLSEKHFFFINVSHHEVKVNSFHPKTKSLSLEIVLWSVTKSTYFKRVDDKNKKLLFV